MNEEQINIPMPQNKKEVKQLLREPNEKCPTCGGWLEVRAEQHGPEDFVMVAYCHGCGYTESE